MSKTEKNWYHDEFKLEDPFPPITDMIKDIAAAMFAANDCQDLENILEGLHHMPEHILEILYVDWINDPE